MHKTYVLKIALTLLALSVAGCEMVRSLGLAVTPTPTATLTPTVTATATPTPTCTPMPTAIPLRLWLNFDPPQAKQGHTLLLEVLSSRLITVTGVFDEQPLVFIPKVNGAWAVVGVPVLAETGARPIHLSIVDNLGFSISTTVSIVVEAVDFGVENIYVPPDRVDLLDPEVLWEEAQLLNRIFVGVTPQRFWQSMFIWPCAGRITSPFGIQRFYNGTHGGYHGGVDLAEDIANNVPVVATNDGRVALAMPLKVHGHTVILDHGWGVYSLYSHLSEICVSEGQQVTQGETIGWMGNTGLSTGTHLHWEMRVSGVSVNPLEWTSREIVR